MALVRLQGRLICATPEERRTVLTHLPLHMRLTLREPGCLFFDIAQDDDPLVFRVSEGFASPEAFEAHQTRTQTSDWGRATQRIRRDYALHKTQPTITPETSADTRALYLLTRTAFDRLREAELVEALRREGALALSLTARLGRAYLGHAAFSPLAAPFPAWALGPLAVRACCRRQGIGEALVRAGIEIARERGIKALFVLGDPAYYRRFGFSAAAARGFQSPYAGPHFQILPLADFPLPLGPVTHAAPFAALSD